MSKIFMFSAGKFVSAPEPTACPPLTYVHEQFLFVEAPDRSAAFEIVWNAYLDLPPRPTGEHSAFDEAYSHLKPGAKLLVG